jgi:hypothetical protein
MSFATVLSALGIGGTTAAGAGAAATAGTGASLGSTLGSIGNAAQSVLGTSALNSAGTGLATGGSQGGLLGSLQSMSGGTGGGGSSGGEGGGGMSDPAMGVLKMIFGGPPPAQTIPDTASTIAGLKQQTDAGKQLNTPKAGATNNSGGFMSGLLEPFMTNGEYDSTKTGGIVGSMLGGMLQSDGGIPQAPEINFGDISLPKTNQSFGNRPWVDDEISSYLAQLLGG